MHHRLLLALLITVAAPAVAVPPYEPLPDRNSSNENSRAAASPSTANNNHNTADNNGLPFPVARDDTGGQGQPGFSSSWETLSQIQQMQQEIGQLRGMVEELQHQMEQMRKQARQRYLDLDMRINQLQGGADDEPAPNGGGAASASDVDDKALYQQASELRKAGDFNQAIKVLQRLLQQAPDGLYAPYSEYWLGELYMVADPVDLDQAKRHFINLLAKYPDHVKVPDGMYKLGKLYVTQGETSKARSTLNELIKSHPDKSAAKLARELLARI